MPRILLLMPSSTYRATDFLAAAHGMEVDVVVGTDRKQTLADAAPGQNLTLDFQSSDAAIGEARAFAASYPLDAVLGVEDEAAVLAARIGQALGLRSNPPHAVQAASDKIRSRTLLTRAGLPGPAFQRFSLDRDPREAARQLDYPCVLKPTFLAASQGVIRADDPAGFAAAFRRIAALLNRPEIAARGGRRAQEILVESFVPGREFALEGLLVEGKLNTLALFDKPEPLDGPYFEETLYITPPRLTAEDQERIASTIQRGASALGLEEGPVHAEARVDGKRVVVMEIAARSIGGLCSRALRFGADLSLEEVILRHALGLANTPPPRESAAAGVLMLPIPQAGILREVGGLEEARSLPAIVGIDITIPVGQEIVPLPEGNRYLGFAFARGKHADEVEEALKEARTLLQFRIGSVEAVS
jgi:biotin carboxylase